MADTLPGRVCVSFLGYVCSPVVDALISLKLSSKWESRMKTNICNPRFVSQMTRIVSGKRPLSSVPLLQNLNALSLLKKARLLLLFGLEVAVAFPLR